MANPLHELPRALLQSLGRPLQIDALMQSFASTADVGSLKPVATDDPGKCILIGEGLALVCRCLDAGKDIWGVEHFTLQTAASATGEVWRGPWPVTLPAERTTLPDAVKLWGEPAFQAAPLAYFDVRGPHDERWGLSCQFARNGALESLTLMRLGDWLPPLTPVPAGIPVPAVVPSQALVHPDGAITCRSAERVPKSGVYEARLPSDHPSYRFFITHYGRLVRAKEGQRMLKLGVEPSEDERLVIWTWLREA